jgi:GNAT superfamily N-acetyltransferase
MEIRRLDLASAADVDGWLGVDAACLVADVPDFPAPCRTDLVVGLAHPWPGSSNEHWVAVDGERVVGIGVLRMPVLDNLDNADLELSVHPSVRRRGIGRALFECAVERARAGGRKWLIGEVRQPLNASGGSGGSSGLLAGGAFAGVVGASTANTEVRRRLDLDGVDQEALDSMVAGAREKAAGYVLRRWAGAAPDDVVAGIAALDSSFVGEAPMGELVYEDEKVDPERIRAGEAAALRRGRRMYHTVACHEASGVVVAWTTIGLNHCPDSHGWQQITLVAPKHRGHRLGLLVKLSNLAQAREHEPALRVVNTWNARQNGHMIAINEAMGFRAIDAWDAVQVAV